jgi:hypothetical protein
MRGCEGIDVLAFSGSSSNDTTPATRSMDAWISLLWICMHHIDTHPGQAVQRHTICTRRESRFSRLATPTRVPISSRDRVR